MEDTAEIASVVCARPDVRQALDTGTWSTVLRAFLDLGMSQTQIAAQTGISQSQVSRLAGTQSREPGISTVRALCDGLGIPRRLAGLADAQTKEDSTNRRQFLGGALGITAGVAGLGDALIGDERLLMDVSLTYRQLEQRTPSRVLIEPVKSHLSLASKLAHRATGKHQERMFGAVSEAAGLAAWLHADLVEPSRARELYKMSIGAAQRTKNPLLPIYMQGSLGQYATAAGDASNGLRLIRSAAARLPRTAPDTARAWLACLEAVALSHLHDRDALKMLSQADRYAEAGSDQEAAWPWVFRVDATKVASYRSVVAARLGRLKMSASALNEETAVSRSPKQSAANGVERARALAATGQVEQACTIAVEALGIGQEFDSERVRQSVRDFRTTLGAKAPLNATAELDDRLRRTYGQPR